MRVVGGFLGSRRLAVPPGGVRPTSDRVREALFSLLGELCGLRVLDLYAGSGALGIEAISRGAESAVFVDRALTSLRVLQANLDSLGISERARVLRGDAQGCVRRLGRARERFDLVFVDPPYASQEAERAAAALVEARLLSEGAKVVFELPKRHSLPPISGLAVTQQRRYGDTAIVLLVPRQAGRPPDRGRPEASRTTGARRELWQMKDREEDGGNG